MVKLYFWRRYVKDNYSVETHWIRLLQNHKNFLTLDRSKRHVINEIEHGELVIKLGKLKYYCCIMEYTSIRNILTNSFMKTKLFIPNKSNKNKIEISFPADFIKANVQPAPPL
mgnify:CR=1 FL=1